MMQSGASAIRDSRQNFLLQTRIVTCPNQRKLTWFIALITVLLITMAAGWRHLRMDYRPWTGARSLFPTSAPGLNNRTANMKNQLDTKQVGEHVSLKRVRVGIAVMTPHYLGAGWSDNRDIECRLPAPEDHLLIQCRYSDNSTREWLEEAGVHWYHLPHIYAEQSVKPRRKPWQVRVGFSMESAAYYPQMDDPRLLAQFDALATYRLNSTVLVHYFRNDSESYRPPDIPFGQRSGAVVFMQRNCGSLSGREDIVRWLMKELGNDQVHSWGSCMYNQEWRFGGGEGTDDGDGYDDDSAAQNQTTHVPNATAHVSTNHPVLSAFKSADDARADKRKLFGQYRVCIAVENSIAENYFTEKVFDAWAAGCVPVYYGAPDVVQTLLPHNNSVILIRDPKDASDMQRVKREILSVLHDEQQWLDRQQWRLQSLEKRSTAWQWWVNDVMKRQWTDCQLCELAWRSRQRWNQTATDKD